MLWQEGVHCEFWLRGRQHEKNKSESLQKLQVCKFFSCFLLLFLFYSSFIVLFVWLITIEKNT
jgi:hypothetical protein